MHITQVALPLLTGLATVNAALNFDAMFKADPALKHIKPTTTKPADRLATAHSIIAFLQSSHSASLHAASIASAAHTRTLVTSVKPTKSASAKGTATSTTKASPKNKRAVVASGTTTSATIPPAATCAALSWAFNYIPTPNTAVQFSIDSGLSGIAVAALAPAGFTRQSFNQYAAIEASSYLGSSELSTYNASQCAAACNAWAGSQPCVAFNMYFEREPTQFPGSNCPNPSATTSVRCALYGSQVVASQAINYGEFRSQFIVLLAGSNLYWKNTAPVGIAGFTAPTALPAFVDVSTINGVNVVTGSNFYPGTFDPTQCSTFCATTNSLNYAAAVNAGQSVYTPCNYFDAASISVQGTVYGTYCGLYTTSAVASTADIYSQTISQVQYDVTYSYGYAATTINSGIVSSHH
ncbi:hypothetical protein ANO11243_061880 [Dothideomycetidae sp. 11243]|nr:hypothetical protein ANO11243_061880 [fungal sp. No.11243]